MKKVSNSLYIGAMSGTSVDGLDLALVNMIESKDELKIEIVDAKTVEITSELTKPY